MVGSNDCLVVLEVWSFAEMSIIWGTPNGPADGVSSMACGGNPTVGVIIADTVSGSEAVSVIW